MGDVPQGVINDQLTGKGQPKPVTLAQADRIEMGKFIEQAKVLIQTLGCDLFKVTSGQALTGAKGTGPVASLSPVFRFSGNGYDARAVVLPSGEWVVKAQSAARLTAAKSLAVNIKSLRQQLQEKGKLQETGGKLVFQEDCLFSSASTSASMVCGSPTDGRNKAWKLDNGMTYGEWTSQQSPS